MGLLQGCPALEENENMAPLLTPASSCLVLCLGEALQNRGRDGPGFLSILLGPRCLGPAPSGAGLRQKACPGKAWQQGWEKPRAQLPERGGRGQLEIHGCEVFQLQREGLSLNW